MYRAQVLKILIASPSDTKEECEAIEGVINRWNVDHSEGMRAVLLPVRWTRYGYSMLGGRPQQLLNKQFVDGCDMLIGLFWSRLGTDTGISPSGTVEEIDRFISMGKPVQVYVSSRPVASDVDIEQLVKLRKFVEERQSQGLIFAYRSVQELIDWARTGLIREIPTQLRVAGRGAALAELEEGEEEGPDAEIACYISASVDEYKDGKGKVTSRQRLYTLMVENRSRHTLRDLYFVPVAGRDDVVRLGWSEPIGALEPGDKVAFRMPAPLGKDERIELDLAWISNEEGKAGVRRIELSG